MSGLRALSSILTLGLCRRRAQGCTRVCWRMVIGVALDGEETWMLRRTLWGRLKSKLRLCETGHDWLAVAWQLWGLLHQLTHWWRSTHLGVPLARSLTGEGVWQASGGRECTRAVKVVCELTYSRGTDMNHTLKFNTVTHSPVSFLGNSTADKSIRLLHAQLAAAAAVAALSLHILCVMLPPSGFFWEHCVAFADCPWKLCQRGVTWAASVLVKGHSVLHSSWLVRANSSPVLHLSKYIWFTGSLAQQQWERQSLRHILSEMSCLCATWSQNIILI